MVAEEPQRWEYFEQLRERYSHVYLQVPLSAIIPQKRVDHLLQQLPPYFNPGSFHSNRLHFVICNRNMRPIAAVDCRCEEDHKTQFKRTLLTEVQITCFFLPKDHALIFSDQMKELLEKTVQAEPLSWNREPAGGVEGEEGSGPVGAGGLICYPQSEIRIHRLTTYHEKETAKKRLKRRLVSHQVKPEPGNQSINLAQLTRCPQRTHIRSRWGSNHRKRADAFPQ